MSRVALDGCPLGDVEKEYLLETIRHLSSVYFEEGHWAFASWEIHLLARMYPEREFSDNDIKRRFKVYYGDDDRSLFPSQVFFPMAGAKDGWSKLARDMQGNSD